MKDRKPRGYWLNNPKNIFIEAKKYQTRKEFEKHSGAARIAAIRLKIYDQVCQHMIRKKRFSPWTIKEATLESSKYTTIQELRKNNPSVYRFIKKNKLFKKCCSHLKLEIGEYEKFLNYLKISLRYNDYNKFKKENHHIIIWAQRNKVSEIIKYHFTTPRTPLNKYEIQQIALKYKRRKDFRLNDCRAYKTAKKLKCLEEICSHMRFEKKYYHPIKKKFLPSKISLKEIFDDLKKYKTRKDFYNKNRSLFSYCKNNNIYNKVCKHMPKNACIKYTFNQILKKAKRCKTLSEFNARYPKEYKSAYRRNYINKICKIVDFEFRDYSVSLGEKTTLYYINNLLNLNLRPCNNLLWLKNNGNQLRLDGYDKINKIAFEYHGFRHLQKREKQIDALKRKLCKKHGVILIIIKEYQDIKTYHFIRDIPIAVQKECKRLNLKIINPQTKVKIQTNSSKMNMTKIKKAIKECTTLLEFKKKHTKMFRFLTTYRLTHLLKKLKRQFIIKTKEELLNIAKKCKTIQELRKKYPKEYNALYRRHLLKETKFAYLNLSPKT